MNRNNCNLCFHRGDMSSSYTSWRATIYFTFSFTFHPPFLPPHLLFFLSFSKYSLLNFSLPSLPHRAIKSNPKAATDLGCGTGLSMYMLDSKWPSIQKVTGIDLSTFKLAVCEEKKSMMVCTYVPSHTRNKINPLYTPLFQIRYLIWFVPHHHHSIELFHLVLTLTQHHLCSSPIHHNYSITRLYFLFRPSFSFLPPFPPYPQFVFTFLISPSSPSFSLFHPSSPAWIKEL